jgi:hypothetical protein
VDELVEALSQYLTLRCPAQPGLEAPIRIE